VGLLGNTVRLDQKFVTDPVRAEAATEAVARDRNKKPGEIASAEVQRDRQEFLQESLQDTRAPEEIQKIYERILGGNDLMPVAYLQRGAIAARAVARIDLGNGSGTGFLIAPRVLITNNHVLPDKATAARALANFRFEVDLNDTPVGPAVAELKPDELFFTSDQSQLDFTVVAVDSNVPLAQYGCLPLIETTGKVSEGEWVTIIQHPNGGRKQVCVRENKLIQRKDDVLWYTTDTEPGSSGSPVFNNDWYVVALHHAGVPETKNGVNQTDSSGAIKWIANEGIRVSRIVQTLKQALPNHDLLRPLYNATPASARIGEPPNMSPVTLAPVKPTRPKESTVMAESRIISVPFEARFQVQPDGQVVPLPGGPRGTESFGGDGTVSAEAAKKKKPPAPDAPFNPNYKTREGYQPDFLGGGAKRVGFPQPSASLAAEIAPLIPPTKDNVLHYHNYSVLMHKKRRIAIYSAANVSFGNRFEMGRPPDVWRRDPRLLAEHQLESFYYAHNQFDRGHLTRREDLEFGKTPNAALESAADTCHWTNCTPQHSQFNQNKEIWQGIERYVLETSIRQGDFDAQIITGPIIDEGDPEYRKIQYPLRFWKVVAAINSKKQLFATAYMASQEDVIKQFGIEVTEVPFGAYKTYQTKISEIERLTGLIFVCGAGDKDALRNHDPLEQPGVKPKKKKAKATESTGGAALPPNYYEIEDLDDITV
jgi:endonuclease G, mitochondrial